MSLALRTAVARMALSRLMVSPAPRPSLDGGWLAAWDDTVRTSSSLTLPSLNASKVRYSVMTLVMEAGKRRLSAKRENSTSPDSASTTMAA